MKKNNAINSIYLLCIFLLTGCYSTVNVTSKERLDKAIAVAEKSLKQMGYKKTGLTTGNNTETTRTEDYIYMPNVGIIPYSEEKKNVTTTENYSYADSNGNTLTYSIAYESKMSHENIWYVENIRFVGCSTSNPDHYEKLCSTNSPVYQITKVPKKDTVSVYNEDATYIAIFTPILAVGIVALVWLMTAM